MTDPAALAAALLRAPERGRLIAIGATVVTLSLGGKHHDLPLLPDNALRVLVHPSGPGAPLSGWAIDARDHAPVPAVLLLDTNGTLIPAERQARPDIRATQGLHYDMTGFELRPPEGGIASLFFLLRSGLVRKRLEV